MTELTTRRLSFRLWTEQDFDQFAHYFADEERARYVGGKKTREEAWRLMVTYLGHYTLKGFGYMAVEEKATNRLVGCVGLWKSEPWPELELGYWLLPSMQGKGYASEAGVAVRDFAFDKLNQSTFVSYIDPANTPSIKVAQKLGAAYDKTIELLSFGPHQVYRYSR